MTAKPSSSTDELFDTMCQFITLHQTKPSVEARLAAFIVKDTPSFTVRVMFCSIAVMMIWVILVCCTSIILRWRKGTLWFVRSIHKSDGEYFTPHVGSMFALTSIFSAVGVGLLICYEINFWDGKVLPNPLILQTLVWYPAWLGSFCMAWGAAISALSLFNQPEVRNCTLGLDNVKRIQMSPRVWNCLFLGSPLLVSIALIASNFYANHMANILQARVREIFSRMESLTVLASDSQQCSKSPAPTSPTTLALVFELFPLLLVLSQDSLNLTNSMQISFACWSLGGIINFALWVPCFVIQLKTFQKQVDCEKFFSHPKPSADRISPREVSLPLELSGNPVVYLDSLTPALHGKVNLKQLRVKLATNLGTNNSYRTLVFSSLSYTMVTVGTICLTLWGVISPDVVLKDGKVRLRFLSILLVLFAFYGISINLGILYQAWLTSRKLSGSTEQTTKKAKQFHFSLKSLRYNRKESI